MKDKVLLQNFTSLSILQIVNYLFPLITFPYLVRVLGPERFGLISFASAFVGYFGIITDYGFNLSATREISINRKDSRKISEIYSTVVFIKSAIFIISFLLFVVIIFYIPKFQDDSIVYLVSFGSVLGSTLFPIWLFQGLERMKYITILNVISRFILTIFIFALITKESDFILYIGLVSISSVLVGIVSLFIVSISFKVKFILPGKNAIKYQLIEGWYIFISSVSISLYTISNTFILGLFTNNNVVGYFSAADKIRIAVQRLFGTVSQTVYPHISLLYKQSVSSGLEFARKLVYFTGSISFLFSLVLFLFAPQIIKIILGDKYLHSILVLRIIAFLPFIITLSNIVGIQTMLNLDMKKAFTQIIVLAGIINLILAFTLVPFFDEVGTSISVMTTEILVTAGLVYYLSKKKISILKAAYV